MPSIQGSSRILTTSGTNSLTGPAGPIGPSGATGATGATGPIGGVATGIGIISATGASGGPGGSYGNDLITFYLTDGSTVGVSGARGATGVDDSENFQIINAIEGPEYGQIFQVKNGITAYFKSLTVSGEDISIGVTSDYTILLSGTTYDQGRLGNTGELVYNFSGASAHGALNTFWSGDQLTARILTHRESKTGELNNNIVIGTEVNQRGSNPINTSPIAGTAEVHGTVVPFTYITQHQENSNSPITKGMVSAFHLGKTGDDNVIYEFTGLTFDNLIQGDIFIGSCCFCENSNGPDRSGCVDYVNKTYCDSVGGSFSSIPCLNRPEGPDCYPQGACCLLGGCTETSEEKCQTYGGFFVDGNTCQEVELLGGCPDPCSEEEIGACCINQVCFELTEYQCSFEPNSVWIQGSCTGDDAINCCLETQNGACCLDEACYNTSALLCSKMVSSGGTPGIFWGIGSKCAGPDEESLYYPHDCTRRGFGNQTFGELEDGLCPNGDLPPCTDCVGWTQEISSDPTINICAADDVYCPCDTGDGQYGCNVCGSNLESCSTIITVDGTCWECCCETKEEDEEPPVELGACCVDQTCSYVTVEECNNSGGYFLEGQTCESNPCSNPQGACCYEFDNCQLIDEITCSNSGGTFYQDSTCSICDTLQSPLGACCYTDGSCIEEATEEQCDITGGEFKEDLTCSSCDTIITGACCNSDGTCTDDSTEEDCDGKFNEGLSCADAGCDEVGICCGGAYNINGQPRPCTASGVPITETICDSLSTQEYPTIWYSDTNHECCGSCCWWGGNPGEESYHCDETGNKLFYDCENLADVGAEAGTVPCYPDGDYQDVTWTSGDCSSENGNQGCPNEIIGCCLDGEVQIGETSKCYCEQYNGNDSGWTEGPCPDDKDTNACCITGFCVDDIPPEDCAGLGGTTVFNTLCNDTTCDGACCDAANADCTQTNETACFGTSTFLGVGVSCDACQAFTAEGACCFQDGTCEIREETNCAASNGYWQGPETTCNDNDVDCSIYMLGACCSARNALCVEVTEAECASKLPAIYEETGDSTPPVGMQAPDVEYLWAGPGTSCGSTYTLGGTTFTLPFSLTPDLGSNTCGYYFGGIDAPGRFSVPEEYRLGDSDMGLCCQQKEWATQSIPPYGCGCQGSRPPVEDDEGGKTCPELPEEPWCTFCQTEAIYKYCGGPSIVTKSSWECSACNTGVNPGLSLNRRSIWTTDALGNPALIFRPIDGAIDQLYKNSDAFGTEVLDPKLRILAGLSPQVMFTVEVEGVEEERPAVIIGPPAQECMGIKPPEIVIDCPTVQTAPRADYGEYPCNGYEYQGDLYCGPLEFGLCAPEDGWECPDGYFEVEPGVCHLNGTTLGHCCCKHPHKYRTDTTAPGGVICECYHGYITEEECKLKKCGPVPNDLGQGEPTDANWCCPHTINAQGPCPPFCGQKCTEAACEQECCDGHQCCGEGPPPPIQEG